MTKVKSAVPPWPVALCVFVVFVVRAVSSQLNYRFWVPWQESAMEVGMGLSLLGFWLFPPRRAVGLRLAAQLGLVCLLLLGPCARAHEDDSVAKWVLLHRPIHLFLLSHGLARLLAQLRLDASLPVHEVLGPTALFLFWGLMLPAGSHVLPENAPKALTAVLLVVPIATAILLRVYFRRGAGDGPWWRKLAGLSVQYWSLPALFLLGELGSVLFGVWATLD